MTTPTLDAQARFFDASVAVRPRDDLRLLLVRGEDARSWINGQVTNDVRATKAGDAVYALIITTKGKISADVWVLDRGDDFALALPASVYDTTRERLDGQIFMEDVELEESDATLVSVQGPRAAEVAHAASIEPTRVYGVDEIGTGGVLVVTPPAETPALLAALETHAANVGGGRVDDDAFELARLRHGRPRFEIDFDERVFPQEAGLKDLAVSFSKGCYVGQEAVVMLEHRGRVRKTLVRLDAEGAPLAGASITDDAGGDVGTVTSVTTDPADHRGLALGYVKREDAEAGRVLRAGNTPVTVRGRAGAG